MDQVMVWIAGFRKFLLRGNVVDLAIAVVIGGAFGLVVTAVVNDVLLPIVGVVIGKPDFRLLSFSINRSVFNYGDLINKVINFVGVAAAIYFIVVKPMELLETRRAAPAAGPTTRPCPECMSDIPMAARRCAFCTAPVSPVAPVA
ncbi:MAG TPA: large conductance mechanosensitive channel protein MscL [Candidatus Dormibacteraeota bacterium]|nr:large conductance mechanosensitive channel protein MscL [Candidatus Dormibacteraeota bacterium]